MPKRPIVIPAALALLAVAGCADTRAEAAPEAAATVASAAAADVARGKYLTRIMGCNDCHTPWAMTERGPEPDMSRELSGHPQGIVITRAGALPGPWVWGGSATNTAFTSPAGVAFAANLTPDPETGLGKWTAETFIATIRNGRHEGQGRPLLPPMPWPMYRNATDDDLRAIFGYLQSLPPVKNRVPLPLEPQGQ